MEDARRIMKVYKDLRPAVQASSGFGGSRMSDTSYSISGPDLNKISEYVDAIVEKIGTNDKIGNADSSYISRKPEVHVKLDRERAYRLGVRLDVLSTSLRTLVGGADQITRFKENDELYEVRVRLRPEDRGNAEAISGLLLPTTLGTLVRLDSVASITAGFGHAQIDRRNRQRSITVNINLGKYFSIIIEGGGRYNFLAGTTKYSGIIYGLGLIVPTPPGKSDFDLINHGPEGFASLGVMVRINDTYRSYYDDPKNKEEADKGQDI